MKRLNELNFLYQEYLFILDHTDFDFDPVTFERIAKVCSYYSQQIGNEIYKKYYKNKEGK